MEGRGAICAAWVGIAVAGHFFIQAWHYRTELFVRWQDEYSYLIQARMLAMGRLWMPGIGAGIGEFFDSPFLTVDRVYASIYFPGTAVLLTPGVWLNLPFWVMPAVIASAGAAFFYLLVARIFNPVRGVIAVLMLVSLLQFREVGMMALSEAPFFLAEMVLLWAWVRWWERPEKGWAWLIGAAAGYAAITRPVDAICFAAPVGAAMMWQLLRSRRGSIVPTLAKLVLAALPFLAIQAIQNVGVTGRWDTSAEARYVQRYNPAPLIGFYRIDPANMPRSSNPARQEEMNELLLPGYQEHRLDNFADWARARLARTYEDTLPHPMLALLIPAALLGMGDPRRRVIVASLILFLIFYALNPFYLDHYTVAIICPMICLVFMAWEAVEAAWPNSRPMIGTFMTLLLVMLSVVMRPLDFSKYAEVERIDRALDALSRQTALVMFRFDAADPQAFYVEPVYNISTADPDDALIVRAHDLGEREDRKLYEYYAQRQPGRVVYIHDRGAWRRGEEALSGPLGTVAEMAEK